jgi:hypothetical protein
MKNKNFDIFKKKLEKWSSEEILNRIVSLSITSTQGCLIGEVIDEINACKVVILDRLYEPANGFDSEPEQEKKCQQSIFQEVKNSIVQIAQ